MKNNSKIKQLINEVLLEVDDESTSKLNTLILEYDNNRKKINKLLSYVKEYEMMQKQNTAIEKEIFKTMQTYNKVDIQIGKYILNIKNELKYKKPTISYKDVLSDLFQHLNKKQKEIALKLEEDALEIKKNEKEDKLNITVTESVNSNQIHLIKINELLKDYIKFLINVTYQKIKNIFGIKKK